MKRSGFYVAAGLAVASLPFVAADLIPTRAIAWVLYYALAAVGLNLVMGLGNMASIGHGAFMAVGALTAAVLRTDAGWNLLPATLVAAAATALAAYLVGHGAVRLRAVHLAVATWLGAWLVALFLSAFPSISGGAGGLVIPEGTIGTSIGLNLRATDTVHLEIALVLLVGALLLFRAIQAGSLGMTLATIKQNPREAAAIGTLRDDLRQHVFVLGAAFAGLAGALGVQLSGLFDASSFGVLLSVALFLAVLLGGPGRLWAPVVGTLVIGLLPLAGQPLVPLIVDPGASGELLAGGLLLGAVALRAGRSVPSETTTPLVDGGEEGIRRVPLTPPVLTVDRVTKRFGGLTALDDVSLEVRGGMVHGVIGPNGSGKSTLLSIISGHRFPSEGRVLLDGADITAVPAEGRIPIGIARSLQSTELFPDMTALDHLVAATLADRVYGGFFRSMLRTPLARAEEMSAIETASSLLDDFGLTGYATTRAQEIPAGARRILMMAVAIAGRRVILLDEPSAGMSPAEIRRTAGIVMELKERGAALVVVEHNMRLLRSVADVITVLDGGRVIAHGDPGHVYEHPEVRLAYLGRAQAGAS